MAMQKAALNVSGIIFLVIAILHVVRWALEIPVTLGEISVPPMVSSVGAVVTLSLALWMFIAARKSN